MMLYDEIFDITTTDVPFYDGMLKGLKKTHRDKVLTFAIVEMSPDDYLNKCTAINNCTLDQVLNMIYEPNVIELIEVSKRVKLPLPFLDYSSNGQEGRHRAVVAKRLGLEVMPVMVITD